MKLSPCALHGWDFVVLGSTSCSLGAPSPEKNDLIFDVHDSSDVQLLTCLCVMCKVVEREIEKEPLSAKTQARATILPYRIAPSESEEMNFGFPQ